MASLQDVLPGVQLRGSHLYSMQHKKCSLELHSEVAPTWRPPAPDTQLFPALYWEAFALRDPNTAGVLLGHLVF